MPLGLKKVLQVGFEGAWGHVPEALKAEGFGVLTEIDVAETLKQADARPGGGRGGMAPNYDPNTVTTPPLSPGRPER
jgi:hypothetical protein